MISNQQSFLIFQKEIKKKFPKRAILRIYFINQTIKENILQLDIKALNQNYIQPFNT